MEFEIRVDNFSLEKSLLSGQCFRFSKISDGSFSVFAGENFVNVFQKGSFLKFKESTCGKGFWINYFDLNFNYAGVLQGFFGDLVLESAIKFCGNLHILRQDPFEVLISLLLSSNNNISRMKKIISVLCREFGKKFKWGFSFPKFNQLKNCSISDLEILRAGFRTKYVYDALCKIGSGEVNLNKLGLMSLDDARSHLLKIKGVGRKIADCVLLFAYHKLEVFPVDVWINRVIEMYYKMGLSRQVLSCPGFAQQLLYHSKRSGII